GHAQEEGRRAQEEGRRAQKGHFSQEEDCHAEKENFATSPVIIRIRKQTGKGHAFDRRVPFFFSTQSGLRIVNAKKRLQW
ncbi:MAG: hypothetical protein L0I62_05925, partial [Gammaproteobacteria bacterium]|nr:hypothetical protein [Gammaproteobacteria bacterium]